MQVVTACQARRARETNCLGFLDSLTKTCENMIGLIEKGYYDGIIFHRVIKGFMLQGGDPTGTGRGGESLWGGKFEDEVTPNLKFDRKGLLAMANAGPNTDGSQFFLTFVATPHLDGKHTVFGAVVEGMESVKQLEKSGSRRGTPKEKLFIEKATISVE